jgi:diacylglycerol kinase
LALPVSAAPLDEPPVDEEHGAAPILRARRIVRSFGYAFEGLATIARTQPNFWVHVLAACVALALGVGLRLSPVELAIVVLCIALVLVLESVNTGIETMCDLISPAHHPLIKRAKDISAAAVLIAAAASVVVAVLLFGPRLASLLR